jgi:hypothetical protein
MKSIVISNLPTVMSEKDLFLILSTQTPEGLKRVIIIDDPEISGKTMGVAIVNFVTYENAAKAHEILQSAEIMKS